MEKTREEILLGFEELENDSDEVLIGVIQNGRSVIVNMELRSPEEVEATLDAIEAAQFLLKERKASSNE